MKRSALALILAALPVVAMGESLIPVNVSPSQTYNNAQGRKLNGVTIMTPHAGRQTVAAASNRVYTDATATRLYARPGETVFVAFNYSGDWMNGYVYIDRNGDNSLAVDLDADGRPTAGSELLSYSYYSGDEGSDTKGRNSRGVVLENGARNVLTPPAFTLPADLPEGEYVVRFKVDWNSVDPAGDVNASNGTIMTNGGAILDATLCVGDGAPERQARLHFESNHGFFVANGTETGIPDLVPSTSLKLKLVSPSSCYALPQEAHMRVVAPDGTEVRTKSYKVSTSGTFTITAADMKGGDVYVSAEFTEPENYASTDYRLAFNDEFEGADHSQPDAKRWKRADHNNNSTWNRFVSTSDKVVYLEDGDLVTRCIPCAEEDWESNKNPISPYNYREWMSGAVDTRTKYSFKYGRVDVRSLTNPFSGSFPAIWLLPDNQSAGWPYYGEIDIWEMVNTSAVAHGTVHAQKESQKTGNTPCNYDGLYHVFTFEWTPDDMKWSIDGKAPYSVYRKSDLTTAQLNAGYWPFDKNFYIILNQSVGAGGWAANPVDGYVYETRFDFVRVYQTEEQNVKVGLNQVRDFAVPQSCYDLQGRAVKSPQRVVITSEGQKKIY